MQDPPVLWKGTTIPSKVEEVNVLTKQRDDLLDDLRPSGLNLRL